MILLLTSKDAGVNMASSQNCGIRSARIREFFSAIHRIMLNTNGFSALLVLLYTSKSLITIADVKTCNKFIHQVNMPLQYSIFSSCKNDND